MFAAILIKSLSIYHCSFIPHKHIVLIAIFAITRCILLRLTALLLTKVTQKYVLTSIYRTYRIEPKSSSDENRHSASIHCYLRSLNFADDDGSAIYHMCACIFYDDRALIKPPVFCPHLHMCTHGALYDSDQQDAFR